MINNNFTKKLADALARNKTGNSFDRSIMHLEREWYTLVALAILLLVTGGLWSVYAYKTYSNVSVTGGEIEGDVSVYQAELVRSALNYAEERNAQYESLRGPMEIEASAPNEAEAKSPEVEEVANEEVGVVEPEEDVAPVATTTIEAESGEEVEAVAELAI